jgi:hypothetical protein
MIPLFAVGAFLAFTLSQGGMVIHWRRTGGKRARASMFVNGLGVVATGTALTPVLISKFREGAWMTVILVPGILLIMRVVRRHYSSLDREVALTEKLVARDLRPLLSWFRSTNGTGSRIKRCASVCPCRPI